MLSLDETVEQIIRAKILKPWKMLSICQMMNILNKTLGFMVSCFPFLGPSRLK
jgi:hypothetical protein